MGKYQFTEDFLFTARTIGKHYFRWIRYTRIYLLKLIQHHTVVLCPGNSLFLGQMLIPFQE